MSETIYFNGKKYNNISEMPSNVRAIYAKIERFLVDQNQDGIPDAIQSGGLTGIKETVNMIMDISKMTHSEDLKSNNISLVRVTDGNIYINGKNFSSTSEMPFHIRQEFEQIVNEASDGSEDIFDEPWRRVNRAEYFTPHDDEILNPRITNTNSSIDPPIETIDPTRRLILLILIAILIFGFMIVFWFFLF